MKRAMAGQLPLLGAIKQLMDEVMSGPSAATDYEGPLADCIIEVYAMESAILRAEKLLARRGEAGAKQAIALTRYYTAKAVETVERSARKVIAAAAEGDMLRTQMAILRRFAKYEPADTIALGREIARHVLAAGRYSL
jgi:butyryl-CoA dehydrogenase